jgi:hypothetical protein
MSRPKIQDQKIPVEKNAKANIMNTVGRKSSAFFITSVYFLTSEEVIYFVYYYEEIYFLKYCGTGY